MYDVEQFPKISSHIYIYLIRYGIKIRIIKIDTLYVCLCTSAY